MKTNMKPKYLLMIFCLVLILPGLDRGGSFEIPRKSLVNRPTIDLALDFLPRLEGAPHNNFVHPHSGARGPYQIKQVALDDVRRITGIKYTIRDCHDPIKSREIARRLLLHYCGTQASLSTYLRTWRAGPTGARRGEGYKYVQRVVELGLNNFGKDLN